MPETSLCGTYESQCQFSMLSVRKFASNRSRERAMSGPSVRGCGAMDRIRIEQLPKEREFNGSRNQCRLVAKLT